LGLIAAAIGSLIFGLGLLIYLGVAWRRSGLPLGRAIRAFLTPPQFPREADNRRAGLLMALLQPLLVALIVVVPIIFFIRRDQGALIYVVLTVWAVETHTALYILARRGRLGLACWLLPAVMFVLTTLSLPAGTGVAGLTIYVVTIVTAGMLLGGWAAVAYALLSALVVPLLGVMQAQQLIARNATLSISLPEWLEYAAVYIVTALLVRLVVRRVEANIRQAEQLQALQAERSKELDRSLGLERQRTQELELLADTARRLTGINEPQALVDEAARRVVEVFHFDHAAIFLVEDDHLVVHAARGALSAARPLGSRLPLGEGPVGAVGQSGETNWVREVAHDASDAPLAGFPITSAVIVPLRLAKSVIGVLEVASKQPQALEAADVRSIESLADLIAAGLQASQLFVQLRSRQQSTEALRRIGAAVNESLDLAQIVGTVCLETHPAFEADQVEVWLFAGTLPEQLQRAGAVGLESAGTSTSAALSRRGELLAGQLGAGRARLLAAAQPAADTGGQPELLGVARSLIIAPLIRDRSSFGLLTLAEWRRSRPFTAEDAAAAELLASHLAAAVANARLYADDRRRANELALLSDITSAALEIADYPTLLETLADRLGELIEADGCYLALWNGADRTTKLAAVSRALKTDATLPEAHLAESVGQLTEAVLAAGQAGAAAEDALAAAGLAAAILSLPLIADGQWLGAAHLIYRRPRRFSAEEIAYAERAGRQIALAMAKARALEAEHQRNSELQALHAASLRVTSSLDLRQVLEAILQQALSLAGGQDAHIFLYDGQHLQFGAAMWADGSRQKPFETPRPGGLTDAVAKSAQRIVVPDVNHHPLYQDWQWGGAIVGLPLRSGERVCGVMNVAFAHPRQFDDNDLRVMDLLADQAAVALENARLFNAEREQRDLAEALRDASLALSGSLEFEAVLDRLLDQIERVVPFDAAAILLVQAAGTQVSVARSRGYQLFGQGATDWLATAAFDLADTPNLRLMAETQRPLIIADTQAQPVWNLGGVSDRLHSSAGVPIVAHQQVIAFFILDKAEANYYRQEHADRLSAFAGQAALALQNARLFEGERHRAAQLTLLSEVSQQVTGTLDEGLLLQRVVKAMINRLGFAEASILLPVGGDELEVVAIATTVAMATGVGFRQKFGEGLVGHAAQIGATYLSSDIGRDPYYFDPAGHTVGSALALPLRYESDLPGILYLESSTPGAFSAADVVAYETLANHIATALQNARLYSGARGRLREMTALQSVSQTIVSSLKLDEIFETVVRLLHEQFLYAYPSLYELRGDRLHLKAQVGYPEGLILRDIPITQGISGRAIRTRATQFIPDVKLDSDYWPALPEVESEICVPLLTDREVFGMLNVDSEAGHALTLSDVSLLATLASQVTIAIQNARLFEAERDQRELAEALRQASLALSASLDYDTVLDRLLEQIRHIVPYDSANIMLVDGPKASVARLRGYEQYGPAIALETARLVFNTASLPNLDRMLRSGQPLIISDTAADPEWLPLPLAAHVKSWAGAPIVVAGAVAALFSLDKQQAGFYQPMHATRLAAFVGQAALALENSRLFAIQRRRTDEQRLLLMAARDFSAALSEKAVLQAIVRHMSQALEAASCTISAWDRNRDAVTTLNDYLPVGETSAEPPGATYPLSDYPATRWVLLTRQPLAINLDDPEADAAERKFLAEWGRTRLLMVPLYTGDDVFGLVEIKRGAGSQPFREADQQLALSLAAQAAVALENSRLHAAVQENVRELDALLKANEALLSTLELDPLLHNILAAAIAAIPSAEMGTIVLSDPGNQQLRVRATHGYRDPRVQHIAFAQDQGYSAKAIRENRPLLIMHVSQEPQLALADEIPELQTVASAIVAPLAPKGPPAAPHGVISLDATRPAAFSEADLRILVAFANTAAVAIDNAQLHAEVQRLAVTDSLTGLANPRAFEHALAIEAYRAARYGHSLSLIIMDIDAFKQYNDAHGHLAGNDRLKSIAGILRQTVRDPDLPVRYGGEEFALLLPHTHKAGAMILAERIRELAQAAAPSQGSDTLARSGYTLSLGVATLPTDALSAGQLMLAADNAELEAKRNGKNRVCAAEPLVKDA